MAEQKSVFAVLNAINCNEHVEKKKTGYTELSYLSWAWAWQIAKTHFPDAQYTIYENADGWNYHTDGKTCWVKTGVTINGIEHIEYLPVMNARNNSIPADDVTSFDVNKAIQRSLTKAIARHGLGLYIYAGEDLPDAADDKAREEVKEARQKAATKKVKSADAVQNPDYWKIVKAHAEGRTTKTGGSIRDAWIEMYKPSAEDISKFDLDVQDYRSAAGGDGQLFAK